MTLKLKFLVISGMVLYILAACNQSQPEAAPETVPVTQEPTAVEQPSLTPTSSPDQTSEPTPIPTIAANTSPNISNPIAPELRELTGWINGEPFTLADKRQEGQVVLIDFWTYTCVNCIRTLPYLKQWHEKYNDRGLVILGVHTPEFEFEKVHENVISATEEFGIEWAVAQDNDFGTWRAFRNRFWPAKYLIDPLGNIRYTHFGEGEYDETEEWIRQLLEEMGTDLSDIPAGTDPGPEIDPQAITDDAESSTTRELYAGFRRNYFSSPYVRNDEYYDGGNADILYEDPGDYQNHFLYLHGRWHNGEENLAHARTTENYEDYIALKYFGTSVNAVITRKDDNAEPFDVRITLDDQPIQKEQAGLDIQYDEAGNSFVRVEEPRMYFVISQPEFGTGNLKLSSNSEDFALFAFTFGSYQNGEPVSPSGL